MPIVYTIPAQLIVQQQYVSVLDGTIVVYWQSVQYNSKGKQSHPGTHALGPLQYKSVLCNYCSIAIVVPV